MIPTHSDLCAFARQAHTLAVRNGFYDPAPRWTQLLKLIQGEFHEADADLRAGRKPGAIFDSAGAPLEVVNGVLYYAAPLGKPRGRPPVIPYEPLRHGKIAGFLVEIADVVVRALDAIDHAGARPLIMQPPSSTEIARLASIPADEFVELALTITPSSTVRDLSDIVYRCLEWCEAHNLPLWAVMQAKHAYNLTRPYKHGKVY